MHIGQTRYEVFNSPQAVDLQRHAFQFPYAGKPRHYVGQPNRAHVDGHPLPIGVELVLVVCSNGAFFGGLFHQLGQPNIRS